MRGSELATGIAARYDKPAERCWILALGGGVPRLYTMSTPKTQKSWNQGERVHQTKVREKCEREVLCHRYMSLSLYQDEPSRLPILATVVATWYDKLAQRS
jgi:hypothetical protein